MLRDVYPVMNFLPISERWTIEEPKHPYRRNPGGSNLNGRPIRAIRRPQVMQKSLDDACERAKETEQAILQRRIFDVCKSKGRGSVV